MVKRTGPTNDQLKDLIRKLSKDKKPFWKRIAKDLAKPTRVRRVVNLNRLNRNSKSGELLVVPGKVLGVGELKHKVTIAAWQFSNSALKKLKSSGATTLTIDELYSKGKTGRIIG